MEAVGYVFVSGSAIPSVLQVDGQQGRTIRSACGSASDLKLIGAYNSQSSAIFRG
jgi:hypothetical protein